MSKKTIFLGIVAILIVGLGVAAYWFFVLNSGTTDNRNQQSTKSEASKPASDKNLLTLISDTGELSTFTQAIEMASLSATLEDVGPYTVLAPSNDAFNALPSGTLERLEKPENTQSLTAILNYHIIAGSLLSDQLTNGQKVKTLNGQEVVVSKEGANVYFIDAKGDKALVTKSDIKASNGVIHIINTVLLPQ